MYCVDRFMKTILDLRHEIELEAYRYDGRTLVAEVVELLVGSGHRVVQGSSQYLVTFQSPIAHALTEEFPAAVAELVRGSDKGFLRRIENPQLRAALGVNEEQFEGFVAYALITAHEILVVYCAEEPTIAKRVV